MQRQRTNVPLICTMIGMKRSVNSLRSSVRRKTQTRSKSLRDRLSKAAALALVLLSALVTACSEAPREPTVEGANATKPAAPRTEKQDATRVRDANTAREATVVFLGDSISAGLGVNPELAFPARLKTRLAEKGSPFRLINAGVSGDTTAGGLARTDWLLRQRPRVLVVELGGNDALRGQPLKNIEANLKEIIARARQADSRVLLLGMRIPPSYGKAYCDGFAAIYDRLGQREGVTYVPFFMEDVAGDAELNLPDGIHPTAAGHERLAAKIAPALEALLKR